TQKNIFVNVVEDCPRCKGTQVEPGYKKVSCPYCNGTGMITQRLQGGFFYQASCNRCGGSGHYNKSRGLILAKFRILAKSVKVMGKVFSGGRFRSASRLVPMTKIVCGFKLE
ncbi:DnaJ central domain protein, partial [Teladorsagia circumcincta]